MPDLRRSNSRNPSALSDPFGTHSPEKGGSKPTRCNGRKPAGSDLSREEKIRIIYRLIDFIRNL